MATPPVLGADFERLLEIVLPEGGATVSMVEVCFDESGTHRGSPLVCVAGYIFEKEQAIELDREWRAVLNTYHLPFFRMSACLHRTEPFNHLSLAECATVESEMIAIANKWMSYGMAITVQPDQFRRLMPMENNLGDSPYSFCAKFCLSSARRGIHQKRINGDCAYFFESGHRNHDEANEIMNRMFNNAKLRKAHHYSSHAFIGKSNSSPLQAADLLAWQWYADMKRRMRGENARRLEAQALFEGERRGDYSLLHCDEAMIRELAARSRRRQRIVESEEADDSISPLFSERSNALTAEGSHGNSKTTDRVSEV